MLTGLLAFFIGALVAWLHLDFSAFAVVPWFHVGLAGLAG